MYIVECRNCRKYYLWIIVFNGKRSKKHVAYSFFRWRHREFDESVKIVCNLLMYHLTVMIKKTIEKQSANSG